MTAAPILLRRGPLTVGIAPHAGGSLSKFEFVRGNRRFDILRPAVDRPVRVIEALNMSSFITVPYAGRLREGRFEFEGRMIEYPLNGLPERHSSHGDGFMRPWQVKRLETDQAELETLPLAAAPIQYRCTQFFHLTETSLAIRVRAHNLEQRRIPFEIGFHPYFASRTLARIRAHLPLQWHWDRELMPTMRCHNLLQPDFAQGLEAKRLPMAAEYDGWDGQAHIDWPDRGIGVTVSTQPALRHVVTWAPAGEDFFCFEPLSHATDSFNRAGRETAIDPVRTLDPGAFLEQTCIFRVSDTDSRRENPGP